jgi:hypothetical protein
MPKGPQGQKRPADAIGAAVLVGRIATGEAPDDADASKEHHRRGGKAGGKARADVCIGAKKSPVEGKPDPKHISTSYVERQNLSMRMGMRRFTRLTNAFSKRLENHIHALALYFIHYNFIHKTLRMTPAMAAGVSDRLWTLEDVIARMDADAPKPGPRGPYKKRADNSN